MVDLENILVRKNYPGFVEVCGLYRNYVGSHVFKFHRGIVFSHLNVPPLRVKSNQSILTRC